MLQQQRQQQQVGGLNTSSKLSPSHLGGGVKLPGSDPLPHPGLAGSVADLHQKSLGPYSGEPLFLHWLYIYLNLFVNMNKNTLIPVYCA